MSSTYTVRYAPQALDDLRDLYSYVAFSLKEPATAQKLVNRIRKAARSLDALPGRHPVVDWEPWQSMGMHRFTVEDFLKSVVYKKARIEKVVFVSVLL